MTTTDYIEAALSQRREHEMNLRNERRRVVLERSAASSTARRARKRRGLPYVVRRRLAELFLDAPAHG